MPGDTRRYQEIISHYQHQYTKLANNERVSLRHVNGTGRGMIG